LSACIADFGMAEIGVQAEFSVADDVKCATQAVPVGTAT